MREAKEKISVNTRDFVKTFNHKIVHLSFSFIYFSNLFLFFSFFKVKEEGNIRVIPGTHHAQNRTLTITFRCYVIIVIVFMSAIIKSTVEISLSPTMFHIRCINVTILILIDVSENRRGNQEKTI